ncbi:hypothetical protein PINS_up004381 [Pythium insidiosum]|nr:hypothetical protein PINS_up004381 [Pythium insidiosum]
MVTLGPVRALAAFAGSIGFQVGLMVDASFRATRPFIAASLLGSLIYLLYAVARSLGLTDFRQLVLLQTPHRVLMAEDVIVNTVMTFALIDARNGVRKFLASRNDTPGITRCILYRCHVRLEPIPILIHDSMTPMMAVGPNANPTTEAQQRLASRRKTRSRWTLLRFVPIDETFPADITVLPVYDWFLSVSGSIAYVFLGLAAVSVLCTQAALIWSPPSWRLPLSIVAFGTSVVVSSLHTALTQRQLLRRLYSSFDVVFLSIQLTLAHLCAADLLRWSLPVCLAVLASWLWMHWILTLDALTPVFRQHLRFTRVVCVAVLLNFVVMQALVVVELLWLGSLGLEDRELFKMSLFHEERAMRVVPFLCGRLVTTMSWSLRLLWRLWDRRSGELLMLQGQVEYDDPRAALKTSKPRAVQPLTRDCSCRDDREEK